MISLNIMLKSHKIHLMFKIKTKYWKDKLISINFIKWLRSDDVKSLKNCLKSYLKMRKDNVKILQSNYQKLALLSL